MGRRSVTLAPLAEEGLSRPRLPHHHGPLPGRSKCAAERQARAPCSCFSLKTKALRSAGGQPTGSLRAVPRAGRASEHQGLQVGLSWEVPSWEVPPSVMKAAPLAAPGVPRVPVGGRSSAQGQAGEQGSQALPGSRAGGRLKTRWPRFSAELSGSA